MSNRAALLCNSSTNYIVSLFGRLCPELILGQLSGSFHRLMVRLQQSTLQCSKCLFFDHHFLIKVENCAIKKLVWTKNHLPFG